MLKRNKDISILISLMLVLFLTFGGAFASFAEDGVPQARALQDGEIKLNTGSEGTYTYYVPYDIMTRQIEWDGSTTGGDSDDNAGALNVHIDSDEKEFTWDFESTTHEIVHIDVKGGPAYEDQTISGYASYSDLSQGTLSAPEDHTISHIIFTFAEKEMDEPVLDEDSLQLTSMCIEEDMAETHTRWRVINHSGVEVDFVYEVYPGDKSEPLTVGAEHTMEDRFDNPFLFEVEEPHPVTVKIHWGDDHQFSTTKASNGDICDEPDEPVDDEPVNDEPVTDEPETTTIQTGTVVSPATTEITVEEEPTPLAPPEVEPIEEPEVEIVLDEEVPLAVPELPQTGGGHPIGFYLTGLFLALGGILLREWPLV